MNSELHSELHFIQILVGSALCLAITAGILIDVMLLSRWWQSRVTGGNHVRLPPSPFFGGDAVILAATVILAESVIILGGACVQKLGLGTEDAVKQSAMLIEGVTVPLILIGAVAFLIKQRKATWQQAFTPQSLPVRKTILMGLGGYLAMLPPTALFAWSADAVLRKLGIEVTAQPAIDILSDPNQPLMLRLYLSAAALLIAPILEEIFFRGIALPGLLRQSSRTFSIVAVSAVFALIHLHLPSAPALFVIAVACSLAYLKTGSIFVPIIMHATFNGTTLLVLYLQTLQPSG